MNQRILYFFIIMFVALQSKATKLFVDIKDKESKETVVGAILQANGVSKQENKGTSGIFQLEQIEYPIRLKCRIIGYASFVKSLSKKDISTKEGIDYYTIYLEKKVTSVNELVVTGQAVPVLAKQSIYKVNTISSTDIAQRGATSLSDILNYEMNNFISNDNILGSSVNIGGIGGQNVKVLVNGIPIMGRENGNIDMGQLNLNNVKRIEMIQGPMSVMYGSNALGGVINLITTTPKKPFTIGARTYLESIGRYNFSGTVSAFKKNHQVQFSIARNFFQGWTPADTSNDRYQLWKPKTQYTSDLQYSFSIKKIKFNYFGSYLNEKITNKGQAIINPYEGYAFDEYYRTQRILNSVSVNIPINKTDQVSLINSYSMYKRTKNRFRKDLVSLNQFETNNIGDQDTSRFNDVNLRGTYTCSRIKHLDILAGYEYAHEVGKSYKLTDAKQTMSELGVFASALYKMNSISIQPSYRLTYNNRYKTNGTPALHVKADLSKNTQLRASYARGFRAPSLKELYLQFIDQNHTILGNENLKPEIGHHIELALDHSFSIQNTAITYSVNAYANSIKNLIALAVYNNHGILRTYANIEEYKNWMLNSKAKLTRDNLMVSSGIGFIYVQKSSVTPEHTIFEYTLNTSYTIKPIKTAINFNYKYNSKQPVITVDQQFLYTNPTHIANVSAQKCFFKKSLTAQIGIKNLLNIQNASLTSSINTQSSGHSSATQMELFPARSMFIDLGYSF